MNSQFGQVGQAFYRVFVSNSAATLTSGTTDDLAIEQFGVFKKDGTTGTQPAAVSEFDYTSPRVFIATGTPSSPAQGSPYTTQRQDFNYTSTAEFSAKDILAWRGVKAKAGSATQLVTLGYNGMDASAKMSLNAKLDNSPLVVKMILRGEPIRRYYNNYEITRTYQIDKGLCTASCNCFDPCGKVPAGLVADKLIEAVKRDKWMGIAVDKFVKVNKLESCVTDTCDAPVLTAYKKYNISICDDGATTLGKLQAAYPGKKISKKSRSGAISTYEMDFQLASDTAPSGFVLTGGVVIPQCDTCPSGYTSTAAAKVVEVKYLKGATPATVGSTVSRVLTATTEVHDIYLYVLATSVSDGTIASAFAGVEYNNLGVKNQICSSTSSLAYYWTPAETCNKTTRDYIITLGDTVCGANRLASLQASYPNDVVAIEATGTCVHTYKLTTDSNCIAPEDCGKLELYTYPTPIPFEGKAWQVFTGATQTDPSCTVTVPDPCKTCCVAGVSFEGAAFTSDYKECTFGWYNWQPQDTLPVEIQVSIQHMDYTGSLCDETPSYMTVLRETTLEKGTSGILVQAYERASLAYQNLYWNPNPHLNDAFGFSVIARPDFLYDSYFLSIKKDHRQQNAYILADQNVMTYAFYVPTGTGANLENMINKLVLSTGNPSLHAVKL